MTILAAAALLVTATACSNDGDPAATIDNPDAVPVSITAAMAGNAATATPAVKSAAQPGTRAVGARWNQDHIGVIMYTQKPNPTGGKIIEYGRVRNAHYATTSTGTDATFTPDTPADAIYLSDADGTVMFMAYAPYQPSAGSNGLPGADGAIVLDATLQVNTDPAEALLQQEKLDLLFTGDVTASKDSPVVRFTKVDDDRNYSFRRMMARLILKIQSPAANGFDPADAERISGVSIGNVRTKARMVFLKEGIGLPDLNPHDPDSWKQEWNITHAVHRYDPNPADPATGLPVGTPQLIYTLIIPPQYLVDAAGKDVQALSLSVTLDGNTYKNDGDITGELLTPGLFSAGKSYEYTISLKKKGLEVSGTTITDWADGGSGSGDAVWE